LWPTSIDNIVSGVMRRDALLEYTRSSLWFLPAMGAFVALILGSTLSRIQVGPDSLLAFQGTADDARSLLITIAGTMVTVIALLLGLAVVALQLSSTQFSPRLLRNFLRDRPNQMVLSVIVATFTYSAAGLFQVGISAGQRVDRFPRLAVTVAIALMFISLGLLVFFADHLAHSIQIDSILRGVQRNTLRVARALPPAAEEPAVPDHAVPIASVESGYVQAVNGARLLAAAGTHGVSVRLRPRVGEHVVAGTTLALVWGDTERAVADFGPALRTAVRIGFERTLEQDPGLGLRQMVDAACKALSPAVNDPYTAIQAIHHLSVVFAELGRRQVGDVVLRAGQVSVTIPARTLPEHLELGLGLIRRYGAAEPTVAHALLVCLGTVLVAVRDNPADRAAIAKQADLILAAAERSIPEPTDLLVVRAEFEELQRALGVVGPR
jgi:uncharacterized membrane protein